MGKKERKETCVKSSDEFKKWKMPSIIVNCFTICIYKYMHAEISEAESMNVITKAAIYA